MIRIPRIRMALLLLAAAFAVPHAVGAQTLQGRVTEAESGLPVAGAIVTMLDGTGARHGITLSDAAGRYRVSAGAAGTYFLRVERVGYTASTSPGVRLQAGQTAELGLTAEANRVILEPVVATGAPRACAGEMRDGAQAATMWNEARKALLSTTLAAQAGRFRFVTETRERETTVDSRQRVLRDDTTRQVTEGLPFESQSAEALVNAGYVRMSPTHVTIYGVDAAAILSDDFLEHHCFGLRDGGPERPGMVGLEFVPLQGQTRPDVQGVLWMDRETAELRYVEYGYTGLRFRGPVERLVGRLDFARLPDGVWVTQAWTLVAPSLRTVFRARNFRDDMESYRIWALLERSGRIIAMQPAPPAAQ